MGATIYEAFRKMVLDRIETYWMCLPVVAQQKSKKKKKDGQKRRRFVKHFSARLRISTASKCTHKELCSEFIL